MMILLIFKSFKPQMKGSIFLIFATLFLVTNNQKLLLVQQVFRHGARNPESINNRDGSNISRLWKSVGELTMQGKNMHYLLGKQIYKRYWEDLFGGTHYDNIYNQSKFYVKSTNYNRTIQSAQSHLMGIFSNLPPLTLKPDSYQFSLPPYPDIDVNDVPSHQWQVFGKNGQHFHPIPVHVQKVGSNEFNAGDFMLSFDPRNCPKQTFWINENYQSKQAMEIKNLDRVKSAMSAMNKALGGQPVPFEQAYHYIDNFRCLKYMQLPYLSVFEDPKYNETFAFIKIINTHISLFYTPLQKKVAASGFFAATMENIKKIIEDENSPQLIIYSGHDTTVLAVISALNMTNVDCIFDHWINGIDNSDTCIARYPIYATNFVIELWKHDNKNHTIKMMWNGVARKIPFCDQHKECSLQKFEKWFNQFHIETVPRDCGIEDSQWNMYSIVSILICIIFVMAFIICYQKNKYKMMISSGNGQVAETEKNRANYDVHIEEKEFQMNQEMHKPTNQHTE